MKIFGMQIGGVKQVDLQAQVNNVVEEIDNAVNDLEVTSMKIFSGFHKMINEIDEVNEKIVDIVNLTDDKINSLKVLRQGLINTKEKNIKIKNKIKDFLYPNM